MADCLICAREGDGSRHEGSVGGNVYEDERWYAYHAPPANSTFGQFFLVSKRHFLDFAEMAPEEAETYGPLLARLVTAIKQITRASRVYVQVTVEGIPHFHAWLIPRPNDAPLRGLAFITSARSCSEDDALDAATRLRTALMGGPPLLPDQTTARADTRRLLGAQRSDGRAPRGRSRPRRADSA